jgi:hypothetical protein
MLEAAYAWKKNLPGLAALWAAAGRSFGGVACWGLLGVGRGDPRGGAAARPSSTRWGGDAGGGTPRRPGAARSCGTRSLGELGRGALEAAARPPSALDADGAGRRLPSGHAAARGAGAPGARPRAGWRRRGCCAGPGPGPSTRPRCGCARGSRRATRATHLQATRAEIDRLLGPRAARAAPPGPRRTWTRTLRRWRRWAGRWTSRPSARRSKRSSMSAWRRRPRTSCSRRRWSCTCATTNCRPSAGASWPRTWRRPWSGWARPKKRS